MAYAISDILLSRLSEFVAAQMGLHFPKERWNDLERGIITAAREFRFSNTESYVESLISSPLTQNHIETLASHLTVGETYFFREKKAFELLEDQILPEFIRSRRGTEKRLRIWSAGCCTGEEPYSIAIVLNKLIPDLQDWNITILATDINSRFLEKASRGVYGDWSFRDTPVWIKERYFKWTKESRFEILPHIKKMVTFSYLNLAVDAYPSLFNNTNAMDVIFCRNVLMYFAPERWKRIIHNLSLSLVESGWLIVSPSETSQILFSQLVTVNFPGAILYRKVLSPELRVSNLNFRAPSSDSTPATARSEPAISSFESPVSDFGIEEASSDSQLCASPKDPVWGGASASGGETLNSEPAALYLKALALYDQGRYTDAAENIAAFLSQNQDDAKAMALLSRIYANQGKIAEALNWCERAIAGDKINAAFHYLRATILQEQGAIDEAIKSLKRALYLDQNYVLAHVALGNVTKQHGKLRESKKHFENALSLLSAYRQEEILPDSEGMTAGRLMEFMSSTSKANNDRETRISAQVRRTPFGEADPSLAEKPETRNPKLGGYL
jgi:chemotaxis protein methyltransferase CheR